MFYEIIELEGLSGSECTIYSIVPAGSNLSIFREWDSLKNLRAGQEMEYVHYLICRASI